MRAEPRQDLGSAPGSVTPTPLSKPAYTGAEDVTAQDDSRSHAGSQGHGQADLRASAPTAGWMARPPGSSLAASVSLAQPLERPPGSDAAVSERVRVSHSRGTESRVRLRHPLRDVPLRNMSTDPGPRSLAGDSGDTGAEVVVPGRGPVLSGEAQTRSEGVTDAVATPKDSGGGR